jgi:hypothetical protein
MELDQRVKALEYEIKILKNEIQRTLLDIQEQVLIHYYPTLRSDDSLPPEAIAQAFSAKQAAAALPAAGPAPAPAPIPAVKKVSLEDIRAQSEPGAALTAAAPARTGSDQSIMVNLSEWVSTNAPKIGGERIGKIVEVCGNKGIIPAETKAVLVRIASLSKDAAPDKVPVNEILNTLLKLDGVLGRAADVEEALVLIEEAGLG